MAVTVSLYNHTAARFGSGANLASDTYKLMLCTSATFNAADVSLAAIVKTELANGNGYTSGGAVLTGVAVSTVTTNDAMFDANDAIWTATGGAITASCGILYNASQAGEPPLLYIDFGGTQSAGDTTQFKVVWNASGIIVWTVI